MRPLRRRSAFFRGLPGVPCYNRAARCRDADLSTLKRFLLGPLRAELDTVPFEIGLRNELALQAYVAVTDRSH